MGTHIAWRGRGKWLALSAAFLLVLIAIPAVMTSSMAAGAGWNIFLGLLLFGAVVSGNRYAPEIALVLSVIHFFRLLLGVLFFSYLLDLAITVILLAMLFTAALDLRRQWRSASGIDP